jgi:RHS repeat-associated protein
VAFDANGNVAALVNASAGTVSANYEYGPFGEVIRATGPMAKVNPFRFSTKYQDDETGLLYYGYRYYNPSTGRWLARDPLSEVAFFVAYTQNKNEDIVDKLATRALGPAFCFLENNPTTRYDVLGLQADDDYQVVGPGILVGDDWLNEIFHHIGLADSAELIFYVTCPCGTVPASYGLRASPPPNSSTRHPFPSAWTLMDYAVVGQRTWRMGFAVTTTAILTDMTGVNRVRLYVRCSTPKGNIITIDF